MTRDQIIAMAKAADLWLTSDERITAVERFASLVAAHEREACAALCEAEAWRLKAVAVKTQRRATNSRAIQSSDCADLIRARKEKT